MIDQPLQLLFDEVAAAATRVERLGHVDRADRLLRTCARCRIRLDKEVFDEAELRREAIAVLRKTSSLLDDTRHRIGGEAQQTVRTDAPRDEGRVGLDCGRGPVHECGELGLHLEEPREVLVTVSEKRVQPGIADEHHANPQRDRFGPERGDGQCGVLVRRALDRHRALAQCALERAVCRPVGEQVPRVHDEVPTVRPLNGPGAHGPEVGIHPDGRRAVVDPTDEVRERRVRLADNRSARRGVLRDKHVGFKAGPDRRSERACAAPRLGRTGRFDAFAEVLLDRVDVSNDAWNRSVLRPQSREPLSDREHCYVRERVLPVIRIDETR